MNTANVEVGRLPPLYVFLDEGGNLDFGPSGSRYFTLTAVWLARPFPFDGPLTELRFDMIEEGLDIEYFHASNDRQAVRDKVFARAILPCLGQLRAETMVIEKHTLAPLMQQDSLFYPLMASALLRALVGACQIERWAEIIVITDRIPVQRKRAVVEKAVKTTLAGWLPAGVRYRVLHHDSKSCAGLQVADYINWAVYRKWTSDDPRSFELIASCVRQSVAVQITPPARDPDKK